MENFSNDFDPVTKVIERFRTQLNESLIGRLIEMGYEKDHIPGLYEGRIWTFTPDDARPGYTEFYITELAEEHRFILWELLVFDAEQKTFKQTIDFTKKVATPDSGQK